MIYSYRSTLVDRETNRAKNLLTPINTEYLLEAARKDEWSFVFHQHWVSNRVRIAYEVADMNTIEKTPAEKEESLTMREEVLAKIAALVRKTSATQENRKSEVLAVSALPQVCQLATNELFFSGRPGIPSRKARRTTAELDLETVRCKNMRRLTGPFGAKTQLAQITGLSRGNISHRLHGKKIFDTETAVMFCKALRLPEDWLDVPRRDRDIPAQTVELLKWEDRPHKSTRSDSKRQWMPPCTESRT